MCGICTSMDTVLMVNMEKTTKRCPSGWNVRIPSGTLYFTPSVQLETPSHHSTRLTSILQTLPNQYEPIQTPTTAPRSPTPCRNPCSHSQTNCPPCPLSASLFRTQRSKQPILSAPCPCKPPLAFILKNASASENPVSHPTPNRQCSKVPLGAVEFQ